MDRFGREAIRRWKMSSPEAFDALRDPVAHFEHVDAHYRAVADQLAREDMDRRGGDRHDVRFWVDQRSQSLLETMPLPPREETFLDDLGEEVTDPRGRFLHEGLPHRPHELWDLLEDPAVPARTFQRELQAWYATLPRAPWVEHAGMPVPLFDPDGPGDLVREMRGNSPEIRSWPEATVLTFHSAGALEDAFQVLIEATDSGRAWAGGDYIDRSERALVLPPWRDDGSEPDPEQLARMSRDCGPLERGIEFVVTDHRPRVVDVHAVSWSAHAPRKAREQKPWLLLDVDGVVLPTSSGVEAISATVLDQLQVLARGYELVWATSWEGSANILLEGTRHSSWPVVPVTSGAGRRPDGYDSPRVAPVLDFVGDRPFAWVDDQLSRRDAAALVASHDCLLLRPNPRIGLTTAHVASLRAWA